MSRAGNLDWSAAGGFGLSLIERHAPATLPRGGKPSMNKAVPTQVYELRLVNARGRKLVAEAFRSPDDEAASVYVRDWLDATQSHGAIEVWCGGRCLFDVPAKRG
jgi:hypothetical protein